MRNTRHRAEYESVIIGARQLAADLGKAEVIVRLFKKSWPPA
jgi:hypothetical protein